MRNNRRAFTLFEILISVSLVMVLISLSLAGVYWLVVSRQFAAEEAELDRIKAAIELSFESSDFDTINVSGVTGQVPTTTTPTAFSTSLATPSTTTNADWFAKVARVVGVTPQIGSAPNATNQPEVARILLNGRSRPRYLFAAPAESTQQRFILCSVLGENALTLPPYSSSQAFFDAIWNMNFDTVATSLPSYWSSNLTGAQITAWLSGQSGGSALSRLRVRHITVPTFTMTVNNNHATNYCWVYWNGDSGRMQTAPGSGVTVSSPILAGRLIRVTIGTTEGTAVEKYRINLRKNTSVTVE